MDGDMKAGMKTISTATTGEQETIEAAEHEEKGEFQTASVN